MPQLEEERQAGADSDRKVLDEITTRFPVDQPGKRHHVQSAIRNDDERSFAAQMRLRGPNQLVI